MTYNEYKHDAKSIVFIHNRDFISTSRKCFRPQNSNDDTILADQTDYVWGPEWSHPSIIIITTDISSAAITNLYIKYIKIMFELFHLLLTQHL